MTLRGLKKRERRAVHTLVRRHGYKRSDFSFTDGEESLNAPTNLITEHVDHGWIKRLMRGTRLIWRRVSYECEEWDAFLPSDVLSDLEFDWERAVHEMYAAEGGNR